MFSRSVKATLESELAPGSVWRLLTSEKSISLSSTEFPSVSSNTNSDTSSADVVSSIGSSAFNSPSFFTCSVCTSSVSNCTISSLFSLSPIAVSNEKTSSSSGSTGRSGFSIFDRTKSNKFADFSNLAGSTLTLLSGTYLVNLAALSKPFRSELVNELASSILSKSLTLIRPFPLHRDQPRQLFHHQKAFVQH